MKKTIITLVSAAFLFAACNQPATVEPADDDNTTEEVMDQDSEATEDDATAESAEGAEVSDVVAITIEGNDQMKFNLSEIKVKAGQTVKLTLDHVGKAPVAVMGHNFVLLKQGVDQVAFAAKAVKAKDNDYIPADMAGDVIAHTTTIGGGESTTIEFQAPEVGTYHFLCSFPGHAALMKGQFIVE